MAAWTALPRRSAIASRLTSATTHSQAASLIHRRGIAAGGGGHPADAKVNFWEAPLRPSKWKEEQFVTVSLAAWGLAFYGGYKYCIEGKNDDKEKEERIGEPR